MEITDPDIVIRSADKKERDKYDPKHKFNIVLHLDKETHVMICPVDGSRMQSKGFYVMKVNDPVLIGQRSVLLLLYPRKWKCPVCGHYCVDEFTFVDPFKHNTNFTPYRIVEAMRDLSVPVSHIARMFNVSDTYCHETFMRYVDMKRLPLSSAISIDEVYLNFGTDQRYCFVILDYITKEVIDILPNRYEETLQRYFLDLPQDECADVQYLVCDMYKPYLQLAKQFLPNAITIIDSFHVVSNMIRLIKNYIREVRRRYQARDKKRLEESNYRKNPNYKSIKESDELYILKKV